MTSSPFSSSIGNNSNNLVTAWLQGIGLHYAAPSFTAAGIVTPAALAELDVIHFGALSVTDPDDRRKLFYLVQRIKMAIQRNDQHEDNRTHNHQHHRNVEGGSMHSTNPTSEVDTVLAITLMGMTATTTTNPGTATSSATSTTTAAAGTASPSSFVSSSFQENHHHHPFYPPDPDPSWKHVSIRRKYRQQQHHHHHHFPKDESSPVQTEEESEIDDHLEEDNDDLEELLVEHDDEGQFEDHGDNEGLRSESVQQQPEDECDASDRPSSSEEDDDATAFLLLDTCTTSMPTTALRRSRRLQEKTQSAVTSPTRPVIYASSSTTKTNDKNMTSSNARLSPSRANTTNLAVVTTQQAMQKSFQQPSVLTSGNKNRGTLQHPLTSRNRSVGSSTMATATTASTDTLKSPSRRSRDELLEPTPSIMRSTATGATRASTVIEPSRATMTRANQNVSSLSVSSASIMSNHSGKTPLALVIPPNRAHSDDSDDNNSGNSSAYRSHTLNVSTNAISTARLAPITPRGSSLPTPKSRLRSESASALLQQQRTNPSKSIRTGKPLSTIPSEGPAPMSPLVDLLLGNNSNTNYNNNDKNHHQLALDRSRAQMKDHALIAETAGSNGDEDFDDDDEAFMATAAPVALGTALAPAQPVEPLRGVSPTASITQGNGINTKHNSLRPVTPSIDTAMPSSTLKSPLRSLGSRTVHLFDPDEEQEDEMSQRRTPSTPSVSVSTFQRGRSRDAESSSNNITTPSMRSSSNTSGMSHRRQTSQCSTTSTTNSSHSGIQQPSQFTNERSRSSEVQVQGSPCKRRHFSMSPQRRPIRTKGTCQSRIGHDDSFNGGRNAPISCNASFCHGSSSTTNNHGSTTISRGVVSYQGMKHDDSFRAQIARLREDNTAEHELFGMPDNADDDDDNNNNGQYDEEMRIRVVVRKRPMTRNEIAVTGDIDIIHPLQYGSYGRILAYQPRTRVDLTKDIETISFGFDNVFDEHSTNVQIYQRAIRVLIPSLFDDDNNDDEYNNNLSSSNGSSRHVCVFAYGQTGSGKTFTMMGSNLTTSNNNKSNSSSSNWDASNLGLYYLAALDLFQAIQTPGFEDFSISVSLFEIYGGKLFDLLNNKQMVKCLEDSKGKVCFPGLSNHSVNSPEELMALIEQGAACRSTGTTSRNADSSRSHAVLQLHLMTPCKAHNSASSKGSVRRSVANSRRSRQFQQPHQSLRPQLREHSRLTFIDLAGSERGADTSTASRATRLEGAEINTSLLALKEVIRALATGDSLTHVPFRGSKLTQVLKESFVGKYCRSVMIACISPNIGNCEQTLNTLRYADRVKERNAETGELTLVPSSSVSSSWPQQQQQQHKQQQIKSKKSTNAGNRSSICISPTPTADGGGSDGGIKSSVSSHSVMSSTSAMLDELLGTPGQIDSDDDQNENDDGGDKARKAEARDTVYRLIMEHKKTMSDMLEMVKDEMILVNQADTTQQHDGGNIMVTATSFTGDYLEEMNLLQDRQLSMIANLREWLLRYRLLSGPPLATVVEPSLSPSKSKSVQRTRVII